jgi:type VI secretion system secreted protein Hcp
MGIYMKFGNIVGDATQYVNKDNSGVEKIVFAGLRAFAGDASAAKMLGETGWIPLKTFEWSATRSVTTRAGNGASSQNRGPISTDLKDVTVNKEVDGSSCALLEKFHQDKDGVDCTIVFVRTGEPGEIYLRYKLKSTLIKELHITPDKEGRPNERLVLNFTEIELGVWRIDENNEAEGPFSHAIKKEASQQGGGHPGHGGDHGHAPHH